MDILLQEFKIHNRNLKFILTEIFQFFNGLSTTIINEVFQTNDCPYDLRNPKSLASKHKSTMKYGVTTTAFKGLQIQQNTP